MEPRTVTLVRFIAPHRFVPPYVAALACAVAWGDARGVPVALLVLALCWVTLAAVRLWERGSTVRSPLFQSVVMAVAGSAAGATVVILIVAGAWVALTVFIATVAVEWLFLLPPFALGRFVPRELPAAVTEGLLAPALGYAAMQAAGVPWGLFALTLLVGVALVAADYLPEESAPPAVPTLRDLVPPLVVAIGALTVQSGAVALVLAGGGVGLRPELALLAVPVAVLATVFGWLALADPRPETREWKVRRLVVSGGMALVVGVVLVLVAA